MKLSVYQLLFIVGLLALFESQPVAGAPFVTKTDKDIIIDVSPFFKMKLTREPNVTDLRIDVLSGMVKVDYDKYPGQKSNVDVQVFGLGSNNRRNRRPNRPNNSDDDDVIPENVEPARLARNPK